MSRVIQRTLRTSTRLLRVLAAVFAVTFSAATVGAETAPAVLTVEDAVTAALANNVAVKAAVFNERAKKLESDFSFNKLFPSVSVSATALRLNETNPSLVAVAGGNGVYYTPDRDNLALGLTVQEVFNPAVLILMNQTVLDARDGSIGREQAVRNMTAAVKKMFYQLYVQDRTIELTRSRLAKAQERLRQAEVSYQLGQTAELNFAYASANVENIIPQLRDMETARAAMIVQFQEILGFDSRPDMALSGSLDTADVSAEKWTGREADRLDVRKAELLVKRTENGLKAQNALLMPNLIVQYKADPALNGPGDNKVTDADNWRQSSGGLSLTVSWDLSAFIPMSDFRISRAQLKDQLSLARAAETDARRKAVDDTANKKRAIEGSLANLGNLERALASTKRAYELTEISYKAGAGRLTDLQDAELSSQQAEVALLAEKLKLMSFVFDWDAAYGAE